MPWASGKHCLHEVRPRYGPGPNREYEDDENYDYLDEDDKYFDEYFERHNGEFVRYPKLMFCVFPFLTSDLSSA